MPSSSRSRSKSSSCSPRSNRWRALCATRPNSAERLLRAPPIAPEPEIVEMARLARRMLADALDAFVRADAQAGRALCRRDDQVDGLHDSVFRILLTHMM